REQQKHYVPDQPQCNYFRGHRPPENLRLVKGGTAFNCPLGLTGYGCGLWKPAENTKTSTGSLASCVTDFPRSESNLRSRFMETQNEVIVRYLQDCEAAERNFEDALGTFAVSGEQNEVKRM